MKLLKKLMVMVMALSMLVQVGYAEGEATPANYFNDFTEGLNIVGTEWTFSANTSISDAAHAVYDSINKRIDISNPATGGAARKAYFTLPNAITSKDTTLSFKYKIGSGHSRLKVRYYDDTTQMKEDYIYLTIDGTYYRDGTHTYNHSTKKTYVGNENLWYQVSINFDFANSKMIFKFYYYDEEGNSYENGSYEETMASGTFTKMSKIEFSNEFAACNVAIDDVDVFYSSDFTSTGRVSLISDIDRVIGVTRGMTKAELLNEIVLSNAATEKNVINADGSAVTDSATVTDSMILKIGTRKYTIKYIDYLNENFDSYTEKGYFAGKGTYPTGWSYKWATPNGTNMSEAVKEENRYVEGVQYGAGGNRALKFYSDNKCTDTNASIGVYKTFDNNIYGSIGIETNITAEDANSKTTIEGVYVSETDNLTKYQGMIEVEGDGFTKGADAENIENVVAIKAFGTTVTTAYVGDNINIKFEYDLSNGTYKMTVNGTEYPINVYSGCHEMIQQLHVYQLTKPKMKSVSYVDDVKLYPTYKGMNKGLITITDANGSELTELNAGDVSVKVNASLSSNIKNSYNIILAKYEGDMLAGVKLDKLNKIDSLKLSIDSNTTRVAAMVLDMNSLVPLCEAVSLGQERG